LARKSFVTSFSCPGDKLWILDQVNEIARREKASFSRVILKALEEFIEKHGEGNPQLPLFPRTQRNLYMNPVTEKLKGNLKAMHATMRQLGPMSLKHVRAHFAKLFGVRTKTVDEYVKILLGSGKIKSVGTKLVAVEE